MRIGLFDSGVGGVTILTHLRKRFENAEFFYFGDTANVPYGCRTPQEVEQLSSNVATRVRPFDLDAMVIACNTASIYGWEAVKEQLPLIPVLSIVPAAIQSIENSNPSLTHPTLILGTDLTIGSHTYANELHKKYPNAEILEQSCQRLVCLVEDNYEPEIIRVIAEDTAIYRDTPPGTALLGCTHFPWVKDHFQKALPDWKLVDSASVVGDTLKQHLNLSEQPGLAPVQWFFSDVNAVSSMLHRIDPQNLDPIISGF